MDGTTRRCAHEVASDSKFASEQYPSRRQTPALFLINSREGKYKKPEY